ncbi:MAG: hypothetical protein AAFX50_00765 [Acidobacteriota bacterium]
MPSGSTANVHIDNCSGGVNTLSVTVTDSSGSTASDSQSLPCLGGFN